MKKNLKAIYDSGFVHLLSSNFLVKILGFGSQFLVAAWLTPETLGQIKIAQGYIEFFAIAAGLGLGTAVVKLVSKKQDLGYRRSVLVQAINPALYSSMLCCVLVWMFSKWHLISNDQAINELLMLYALVLIPFVINPIIIAFLQANKQFSVISKVQFVTKLLSVALICVLTYFYQAIGYVLAVTLGFFLTTVYLFLSIRKEIIAPNLLFFKNPLLVIKSAYWPISSYALLSNIITIFNTYIGLFLLDYLVDDRELIGQFGFALTLMLGFQLFTSSYEQFILPSLSEKSHSYSDWYSQFRIYQKRYYIFAGIILVIGIVLSYFFVTYLFGGKYKDSLPFIYLLSFAWFISSSFNIKFPALISLGLTRFNMIYNLWLLPVSIAITYLFIRFFNVEGAAYARLIISVIFLIVLELLFTKRIQKYFSHKIQVRSNA